MSEIPAVKIRTEMINGDFELDKATKDFMHLARFQLGAAAETLRQNAPATVDVGRLIAALDTLQHAKNLFCDAAVIGKESASRKKRKVDDE